MPSADVYSARTNATCEHDDNAATSCSICVVCCGVGPDAEDIVKQLTNIFSSHMHATGILLTEMISESAELEQFVVSPGTKLSKIRRVVDHVEADLVCICDPDLLINSNACLKVLAAAEQEHSSGETAIAFGLIDAVDDGSILSGIVAVDKWLSHRVLRNFLLRLGIGITIPGQFLIASTKIFHLLNPRVDSYLDDLYLGWIARTRNVNFRRVPVVVARETPRTKWASLASQRIRWMKGLTRLFWHLSSKPSACFFLAVHFAAYHALPVLAAIAAIILLFFSPFAAGMLLIALTSTIKLQSRLPVRVILAFLVVFPLLHAFASLFWWVPARRSFLVQR